MGNREFKSIPLVNIKAQSDGRTRAGICAVFGNVDDWNDRIHKGAFLKTIQENLSRVRHLWNHDYTMIPTAKILEVREVGREELPDEVLQKAPSATGGLLVKREYFNDDFSKAILERIDNDVINEMSFAFDVVKAQFSTEPIEGTDKTREIRELLELKLMDTSDVNWGMNGATVAAGAKNAQSKPLGLIYSDLLQIQEEMKAGRRNADSDQKLIDLIHQTAVSLGASCETKESDSTESEKAGAVETDTPLCKPTFEERKRKIEILRIGV